MEGDWTVFLFSRSLTERTSLEAGFYVVEKAMRCSKVFLDMEAMQTTLRRRRDILRELKSQQTALTTLKRVDLVQDTDQRSDGVESESIFYCEALSGQITKNRLDLKALEVDSRHAFASIAQTIAAIKPSALQLVVGESANRFRHELFMEKIATEPKRYLELAGVASAADCMDRVRKEFKLEMTRWAMFCTGHDPVLSNCDLSGRIIAYLAPSDVMGFASCGKLCRAARERWCLDLCLADLERAFSKRELGSRSMEGLLLKQLNALEDSQLKHFVHAQRSMADLIAKWVLRCFPHSSSPLTQIEPPQVEVRSAVVSSDVGCERPAMETTGRIRMATGLFVVRKNLAVPEYVPMPTS